MFAVLRFMVSATRGHWFRPWRSPYLCWRLETYSGVKAEEVDARFFFHFLWQERGQLLHFLRWTGEMREYAVKPRSRPEH